MKQTNSFSRVLSAILCVVLMLTLPGCGKHGIDGANLAENPNELAQYRRLLVQPGNFSWWNYQVLFGISWLKEYTAGLQQLLIKANGGKLPEGTVSNDAGPGLGLMLAEVDAPVAPQGANVVAEAEAFAKVWGARGQFLSQLATHNQALTDARGNAIKNHMDAVSQAVKAQGDALQNVQQALVNELTRAYIGAYSAYVRTYGSYAVLIGNLYKKIDRNSQAAIGVAVQDLGEYKRRSNICMARASRLWEQQIKGANYETKVAQIHWNTLTSKFNWYTSQPYGEECLNRVLLSSHSDADKFLYNLDLKMTMVGGGKKSLYCGRAQNVGEFPEEVWSSDHDLMEYPPFVKKKISTTDLDGSAIEVEAITGVYWPVTYYQLYRVLTNSSPDLRVEINPPPDVEAQSCHIKNREGITLTRPDSSDQVLYKKESREFERQFLKGLNLEEQDKFGSFEDFTPVDSQLEDMSIAKGNPAYEALVMRLKGVFEAVDGCRQSFANRKYVEPILAGDIPDAEPVGAGEGDPESQLNGQPANPRFVEGKPLESILADFNEPMFPQMSKSVRTCMELAEQHRYNAMAKLKVVTAVQELLAKMGEQPPPRMAAPPFQPVQANINNLTGVGF